MILMNIKVPIVISCIKIKSSVFNLEQCVNEIWKEDSVGEIRIFG